MAQCALLNSLSEMCNTCNEAYYLIYSKKKEENCRSGERTNKTAVYFHLYLLVYIFIGKFFLF